MPLLLLNLLAVIGTCEGLGLPFLLVEGAGEVDGVSRELREVVKIVLVP